MKNIIATLLLAALTACGQPAVISIVGDSLSCQGYESRGIHRWPYWMAQSSPAWRDCELWNFSIPGYYTGYFVNSYEFEPHVVRPKDGQEGWLFCWLGINNVTWNTTESESNAWLIYADLKRIWGAARYDGYKVVAFTLTRYNRWTPFQFTIRDQVNELILSDTSLYDILIRADLLLPDPNDIDLICDGIHPTDEGSRQIAELIANVWP